MKNKELFDKTVGILVKAYQDDTLQYTDCSSCAVGNIVAGNNGITLTNKDGYIVALNGKSYLWGDGFRAFGLGKSGISKHVDDYVTEQIKSTGYDIYQIADIEEAFSDGTCGLDGHGDDNFNGLMSVVDALMIIHEADTSDADYAKSLFVKQLA